MPTSKLWRRTRFLLKKWLKPIPIKRPTVDPEFQEMGGLERSAESMRFGILSLEYWVSASGRLRAWVRNNLLLVSVLFVPALLLMPLVGVVLWQLVCWAGMLVVLAGHLALIPILAIVALLCVVVLVNLVKNLFRFK